MKIESEREHVTSPKFWARQYRNRMWAGGMTYYAMEGSHTGVGQTPQEARLDLIQNKKESMEIWKIILENKNREAQGA